MKERKKDGYTTKKEEMRTKKGDFIKSFTTNRKIKTLFRRLILREKQDIRKGGLLNKIYYMG